MATPSSLCSGDTQAQNIFDFLKDDLSIDYPVIDFDDPSFNLPSQTGNPLYDPVAAVTIGELTDRTINGAGVFDALMQTINLHINEQYKNQRINGSAYAEAYISLVQAALGASTQFLLGKDQAYWQAIQTQMQARRAEIESVTAALQLETSKVGYALALAQSMGQEATYALTKMKIATEDATYCNLLEQGKILEEQYQAARAQTSETRSDSLPITGLLGSQIALYKQQKITYEREVEYKIAKMMMDQWVAQKSIDEGLSAPSQFVNSEIDEVFTKLRLNAAMS